MSPTGRTNADERGAGRTEAEAGDLSKMGVVLADCGEPNGLLRCAVMVMSLVAALRWRAFKHDIIEMSFSIHLRVAR